MTCKITEVRAAKEVQAATWAAVLRVRAARSGIGRGVIPVWELVSGG